MRISSTDSFFKLSSLYTLVFLNVVFVSDISAVNLIVGWCLFACSMKLVISSLLTFQSGKTSSIKSFQTSPKRPISVLPRFFQKYVKN